MSFPVVPGYEIRSLIGRGGMGRVYQARDMRLGRTVAIKMLADSDDPELIARFESEVRAIASLSHPNITQLYEFSRTPDGMPYCVMEYVSGGTLDDIIGGRPVPVKSAAEVVRVLAEAVQAAHAEGILHRDLKPSNILVAGPRQSTGQQTSGPDVAGQGSEKKENSPADPRTRAKETRRSHKTEAIRLDESSSTTVVASSSLRISDFGLARRINGEDRITRTGEIIGTPAYMAPEQASGMVNRPGPGVDIYSLGAILFEMLTGRPPFLGADSVETLMLLLSEDPPSPGSLQPTVPAELSTICLKCLEKKPGRRYPSAKELAEDLQRFLDGHPVLARPASSAERLWKWTRRNPWKATAVGLFGLSGLSALAGLALLQSAYSESKRLNGQLTVANQELKQANASITESLDLARDSLNGVVIRLRDELYDVPRVSGVLTEISREALDLQRRLYQKRPDDLSTAHAYADVLYEHSLVVWLQGTPEEREQSLRELASIIDGLTERFPDDLKLKVIHIKVRLDRIQYLPTTNAEDRAKDLDQIEDGIRQMQKQYPAVPELWKLFSLLIRRRMDEAERTENHEEFVRLARERVTACQQFMDAEDEDLRKQSASLWFSQAQRELAAGLLIVGQNEEAESVLRDALSREEEVQPTDHPRASRAEKGQVYFSLARAQEIRGESRIAIESYAQALSFFLHLSQDFPDDLHYRTLLATGLVRSAALNFSLENVETAVQQLSTAESQANEILKRSPESSVAQELMAAIPRFREQMQNALQGRQQEDK